MSRRGRTRALSWVASFLYGTVLVAGLYSGVAGLSPTSPLRQAGFVGALGVLLALEPYERRRYGAVTPRRVAMVLLAVRAGLFVVVTVLDCSGTARSLFLLIPFTAYFSFGRRVSLVLAACCLGAVVLVLSSHPGWYTDRESIGDLLMFCIGLAFAVAMAAVASREDTHAAELAVAAERNRVARDIHDNVGHHLTVISVQLEKASAFRDLDAAAADQALEDARDSARLALDDVRRSVGTLRSTSEFSLADALDGLAKRLDGTGFEVTLDVRGDEKGLGTPALLALYHIAQESLTNARRHAAARSVTLRVRMSGSGAHLEVTDDGRGFVPAAGEGFGLRGMHERLESVGGRLLVDSAPERGTRVTATVPGSRR